EDKTIIDYLNISEFIYNSLISLENINEFYENDDVELAIDFDIELIPELYHQIKEKQLNGHENFTIQQIYFWWSKKSQGIYQHNSDPLISAKLLLAKFNQEIIVDLSILTPALGFLTALFYKLLHNNFKAYKVPNILPIKESIIEYKNEYIVEDNDDNEYKPLEKIIIDIEKLENWHTTPKTSKDFN
ncbi:22903_t:CDS:2, partial [Gigaspora margarita]